MTPKEIKEKEYAEREVRQGRSGKLTVSVGIGRTCTDDADAVIGERRVHGGKVYARHVAGDAIFRGDRAGLARVLRRAFLRA